MVTTVKKRLAHRRFIIDGRHRFGPLDPSCRFGEHFLRRRDDGCMMEGL